MVRGIDTFKQYFAEFENSYIIIGGSACDIIETEVGQNPRATKDIDIILIVEALSSEFVSRFWQFIEDGAYETREKGDGKSEFFRFMKPKADNFPFQIELFARKPDILEIPANSKLIPIPTDEDLSSLSAILMDNDYYNFTLEHSRVADGVRIANTESLICLKAKAYLDLTERKKLGEKIDDNNIKKHFNDIFRLALAITGDDHFSLPNSLIQDMTTFCDMANTNLPDKNLFKAAGVGNVDPKTVLELIVSAFNIITE
ncbi:MAG: hypothetical protein PHV91_02645 [Bacteroidales bacterium]|jgi:hypothetical protein|nr:hypothetical protein [Bacteroidales bacterium]